MIASNISRWGTALLLVCLTPLVSAVPLTLDPVRANPLQFYGMFVDQTTGIYYARRGFEGNLIDVYNDVTAFRAGTVGSTVTLGDGFTDRAYGTYLGARDGMLYGRAGAVDNSYAQWDLTTGEKLQSVDLNNFESRNGAGTFNWGGYSGLNTFATETGIYVAGRDAASNDWRAERIDSNLNTTPSGTFKSEAALQNGVPSSFGWGFAIGDQLFLGESFNSNRLTTRIDLGTGAASTVDFVLGGPFASVYWSNMVYDALTDTLFSFNTETATLYELTGASAALGVSPTAVSETGSLLLLGSGLAALGLTRGRQRGRSAALTAA